MRVVSGLVRLAPPKIRFSNPSLRNRSRYVKAKTRELYVLLNFYYIRVTT